MRRITGRATRTALGGAVALATLALPLTLGNLHVGPSDSAYSVRAGQPLPATDVQTPAEATTASGGSASVDLDDPVGPKPPVPGDDEGSWVWDKFHP